MTNIEKLNSILMEVFPSLAESDINNTLNKCSIEGWDSVHQLSIVSNIEDEFDIMLDPEDILILDSYVHIKEVLVRNGVEL